MKVPGFVPYPFSKFEFCHALLELGIGAKIAFVRQPQILSSLRNNCCEFRDRGIITRQPGRASRLTRLTSEPTRHDTGRRLLRWAAANVAPVGHGWHI